MHRPWNVRGGISIKRKPKTEVTPEILGKMRELRGRGLSYKKIAGELDLSRMTVYTRLRTGRGEGEIPNLSEKEQALYDRFKQERAIAVKDLNDVERGCLGRLAGRGLVVKDRAPVGSAGATAYSGAKLQTVWRLKNEEEAQD